MIIVTVIWAVPQYHTAGGWPAHGLSHSCWPPVPNMRNGWIIWPAVVWVLATAGSARFVCGHKPVPEREINREMQRQAGQRC